MKMDKSTNGTLISRVLKQTPIHNQSQEDAMRKGKSSTGAFTSEHPNGNLNLNLCLSPVETFQGASWTCRKEPKP